MQSGSQLTWLDRNGKSLGAVGEAATYGMFNLSPDGKQIAVSRPDPTTNNVNIWLIECDRNLGSRFTFDPGLHLLPIWSPDGLRVAFTGPGKEGRDIYVKNASGIGEETLLLHSAEDKWTKDWSKDGRYIAYGTSDDRLYALPLFGDRKPFLIVQFPGQQNVPNFSYDGKWVAYDSNESGTWQIYVVSFPAAVQKQQISTNGGAQPRWRRDGKELYYLTLEGKMMAVNISVDTKIEPGIPHMLFDTGVAVDPENIQYSVTSDGQRFLVPKLRSETTTIPITVVTNWTALLKK